MSGLAAIPTATRGRHVSLLAAAAAAALAAAPAPAHADAFETAAAGAVRVTHADELVWALTAACDQGTDAQQRVCRQVRDARQKALAGQTLLIDAERGALALGAWNPATRSLTVQLSACIACGGVPVEGRTWFVTGTPARAEGGRITTDLLIDTSRAFSTEAAAKAWVASLDRARIEVLVRVPDKRRVQVGGKDGLVLEQLAYRVIAPCTGAVVFANPASGAVPADRRACSAAEVLPVPVLTKDLVRDAMKPALDEIARCYDAHKVAGKARLEMTVAGDGTILGYTRTGDFGDSATGACIDAAVKTVVFPHCKRPTTTIAYPITLPAQP